MRPWFVLVLVACGGSDEQAQDAPAEGDTVEVMVMAPDPAGGGGTIPAVGRTVVFAGEAGTTEVQTDADGRAIGPLVGPGEVTVKHANTLPGGASILGVEAGDRLCFGGCAPRAGIPSYVRAPLEVAPYEGAAGVFFAHAGLEFDIAEFGSERAFTACPAPCTDPLDIYAIAVDENLAMLAWTGAPAQQVVEGQPIVLPGPWQPAEPFTGTIRNIPDGFAATAGRSSPPSRTELGVQTPQVSELTFSGPVVNLGPTMLIVTTIRRAIAAGQQEQTVIASVPAAPTYELDAATELLPWVDKIDGAWTLSAGAPYDAMLVTFQQSLGDAPYSTSVLGPAGTAIAVPANIDGSSVVLIERSDMDYAELRQRDHRDLDRHTIPAGVTYRRSLASAAGR